MEGAINSEIQQEKNSSTCTDVTRGTGSAESTAGAENSAWTFRKIIILASLFLVYFVVNSAYSVYAPFFPSEARDKGVSRTVVGLIFGIYSLTVFAFSPFCGLIIPKYGPRFVLLSGIFLCGSSLVLFGFCGMISNQTAFTVFCFLIRATCAIGGALTEASGLSIVIATFPNNVAAVTGAVQTFGGFGFSLGPVVGGVLYTVGGFKLPFIVMGSAMIAVMPVVLIFLNAKVSEASTTEQTTSIFKALRIPGIFVLGLCYAILGLALVYIDPILGPHLKQLGESPTQVGLKFFVFSGGYALLAPGIGWVADKTKWYRGMLVLGFVGCGVSYLLLGPAKFLPFLPAKKEWLIYTALPLCGISGGFCFVTIMPDLIRTARANGMPDNASTNAVLSSMFGTMFYLGATAGPGLAGIFQQHFGFQWATSIAGFVCFGHALLVSVFTLFEQAYLRFVKHDSFSSPDAAILLVSIGPDFLSMRISSELANLIG